MPFSKLATAKLAVNLNSFCLKVRKLFYKAKQILQTDNYCLCMLLKSNLKLKLLNSTLKFKILNSTLKLKLSVLFSK
jgi:hypothetical protein